VHDFLRTVIEEDGPYDGVIGFSQGAALAASFLLCHEHDAQIRDPSRIRRPPFKMAIFINSVMTFSPSETIGSDISEQIKKQEEKHFAFLEGADPSDTEHYTYTKRCSGIDGQEIYGFPADTFAPRISIPTLHLYGTEDQFLEHSESLVRLCRADRAEVLPVRGGHELPRTKPVWDKFAAIFELVAMTASLTDP
jgi:pimeloyl-ACP methyl ester carboxylesterase